MTKFYLAVAVAVVFAMGCSSSVYVNPDEPDKLGGTGIDSQDVRTVAELMSRDLVGTSALADATVKPRIALLPTINESSSRVDTDIITLQMRDYLNQYAGEKATFVNRERMAAIEAERNAKRTGTVSSTGEKMVSGVEYFLTGTIKSLSKRGDGLRSDYLYFSFELIDAESSDVVWSKGYDIKKVDKRSPLYR